MHRAIIHSGVTYDPTHLAPAERELYWRSQGNVTHKFHFAVTYSNHCYSKAEESMPPDGHARFLDAGGSRRVFCPDRFEWSKELPELIEGLMLKPTTTVTLTIEDNWCVFQRFMEHPLPDGQRYYTFMRMKHSGAVVDDTHKMLLHIESAYARPTPPLTPRSNEKAMFGRIAERLIIQKK